jgi:hypothetical protein
VSAIGAYHELGQNIAHRTRGEHLQITLTADELVLVDDFRFQKRVPSRASAIREILKRGLATEGFAKAAAGAKSPEFGVSGSLDAAGGTDSDTAMLQLITKLGEQGTFGPEDIRILVTAFDAAWTSVKSRSAPFSEERYSERAREVLAEAISLTEAALLALSKSNLRSRRNPE